MKSLLQIIRQYREVLFPAVGIFLLWLAISFVGFLTGRAVIDDPGVIVSYLYNACGVLMVVAIVGIVQSHLFGFRSRNRDRGGSNAPALRDDIYDAVISFGLLAAVSYAVLFR